MTTDLPITVALRPASQLHQAAHRVEHSHPLRESHPLSLWKRLPAVQARQGRNWARHVASALVVYTDRFAGG